MKTTLVIPDVLFRRAKSKAAERGQTLNDFVNEALQEKLAPREAAAAEPQWMRGFGTLRKLHKETERVEQRILETFEAVGTTSCR